MAFTKEDQASIKKKTGKAAANTGELKKNEAAAKKPAADPAAEFPAYTDPGYTMPDMNYAPSEDYGKIAAERVGSAAAGQMDAIRSARLKAMRDYMRAMDSVRGQKDANVQQQEAKNDEMRARLNNVMASRGITRGEGAGVNLGGLDAKAMGAIAAINQDWLNNNKALDTQRLDREGALTDQEIALRNSLPSKIEELRMALENQDFSRWNAIKGLEMQQVGLQAQEQARADSYNQQLAMFGLQQDANREQQQLAMDYQKQMQRQQLLQAVSTKVQEMAAANKPYSEILSYVHSIQDPYGDGMVNNIDTYLGGIGSGTDAGSYLGGFAGSPMYNPSANQSSWFGSGWNPNFSGLGMMPYINTQAPLPTQALQANAAPYMGFTNWLSSIFK